MSATVIAIANQKGGVGKTTTVYNLGAALAEAGQRTLLIDLDPQHSLTLAIGVDAASLDSGSFTLLKKGQTRLFQQGNLALIPTNIELSELNLILASRVDSNGVLKKALAQYSDSFDVILLDTPPSLDKLTLNALVAARWIIMPCECQWMAVRGLQLFLDTLNEVKQINSSLDLLAVMPTMYNASRSHEKEILAILREQFGDTCLPPLPYRTEYPNASAEHRPVGGDQKAYWQNLAKLVMKGKR